MQDALAAATDEEPSAAVKQKLLDLWLRTTEPLRQALEARTKDRTEGLTKMLAERAEKETSDITAILTELERAIRDQLERPGLPAGVLAGACADRAGAVRAERRCPAAPAGRDPRRDREGNRGDPGEVRRSAAADVSGGGDVPGAGAAGQGGTLMASRHGSGENALVVRCRSASLRSSDSALQALCAA